MPFPALPILETERLLLRALDAGDLPVLSVLYGDDDATRFLPNPTWRSEADAQAWFERNDARNKNGEAMIFTIVERRSKNALGICLLFKLEEESARAEIGYALGKPYWGKGYIQEALLPLIDYAFDGLALRRLEAEVDPRNAASDRILNRLGFTREGLLRQRWVMKGEVKDSYIYSLLRDEWPMLKDRS